MNIVGINPQNSNSAILPNFKSKIKLVKYTDFMDLTGSLNKKKYEVGYPWTPETMKKGKNLFTTKILDCIAVAIVDGKNTRLAHLCTRNKQEAIATKQKEFKIADVERRLFAGINPKDENIHGFIFGGFNFGDKSKNNYREVRLVEQLFQRYNIPYTAICGRKDVHQFGRFGVFYKNNEDTFYISSTLSELPAKEYDSLATRPKAIEIKDNGVVYNSYKRDLLKPGKCYEWQRKESDVKTFLENQYCDVKISDLDEIV